VVFLRELTIDRGAGVRRPVVNQRELPVLKRLSEDSSNRYRALVAARPAQMVE